MQRIGKIGALALACTMGWAGAAHAAVATQGLVDWFDAGAGVTTNLSGAVVGWTNQGTGNSVTAGVVGGGAPTWLTTAPNGHAMIHFDASKANFGAATDAPGLRYNTSGSLGGGYAVFAVVQLNDASSNYLPYPRFLRTTVDSPALFYRTANNNIELKTNAPSRPASNYPAAYSLGDVAILTAVFTPDSQSLYFNGHLVSFKTDHVGAYSFGGVQEIGDSVLGNIGSILLYDHTASVADLNQTGTQLASDYGVTWSTLALPVPEPAAGALLMLGVAAIGACRRNPL